MNLRQIASAVALFMLGSAAHGQTFFFTNPGAIADGGNPPGTFGAPRVMTVNSNVTNPIQDVLVTISITHTWVGDLRIRLAYTPAGSPTTTSTFVLNRIGSVSDNFTGDSSNLGGTYTFALGGTSCIAAVVPLGDTAVLGPGVYAPVVSNFNGNHTVVEFADSFRGLPGSGTWTLTFDDAAVQDTGVVQNASIALQARPVPCLADFNTDGAVDSTDLVFFLVRFGQTCP